MSAIVGVFALLACYVGLTRSIWPLKMETLGCIETSVTNNQQRVTSQKNENFMCMAAEAWKQTPTLDYLSSRNGGIITKHDEVIL